ANLSGDLAADTTFWLQTGLGANTSQNGLIVQVFNAGGTGNSNAASRYTLAAAPASLAPTAVSSTTISLAWSANGNAPGTVYELRRGSVTLSTTTATAFVDSGLTPLTLYS